MQTFTFVVTTSYQNLASLLGNTYASSEKGFLRNRDGANNIYIAAGYATAPATGVGQVGPKAIIQFSSFTTANTWVKGDGAATVDLVFGSDGYTPMPAA